MPNRSTIFLPLQSIQRCASLACMRIQRRNAAITFDYICVRIKYYLARIICHGCNTSLHKRRSICTRYCNRLPDALDYLLIRFCRRDTLTHCTGKIENRRL